MTHLRTVTRASGVIDAETSIRRASHSRFVHAGFWTLAIVLGLIDTLVYRHSMGPDGISYLDIADAFREGRWSAAFNLNWSPLYPLWLRCILGIVKPSAYWEFTAVHLANFLLYIGALGAFTVFLRAFVSYISHSANLRREAFPVPEPLWLSFGYALFLWSALKMIMVANVTPDMFLSIFIYLASAIVLRIKIGKTNWANFVLLGLVLGIGYLAKTPMFPLALVFLTLAVAATGDLRQGVRKGLLAGAIFLSIVSPFLYHLSKSAGHLTFGESGRLIYSFYENAAPKYYWYASSDEASNPEAHPARQLFPEPAAYAFTDLTRSTYPYWFDPASWYRGFRTKFDARAIARQLAVNASAYYRLLFHVYPVLPLAVLILLMLSSQPRMIPMDVARGWIVLTVPLLGLAMFAVVFAEPRYVGAFFVLLLMGIFAGIHLPDSPEFQKVFSAVLIVLVAAIVFPFITSAASKFGRLNLREFTDPVAYSSNDSWQVADGLHRVGIEPGDKVAWIRPRYFNEIDNYWWARLAKVQIIAEIPDGEEFWSASADERAAAVQSLAGTGVKGVVTSHVPDSVPPANFLRIGSTSYYVYLFVK